MLQCNKVLNRGDQRVAQQEVQDGIHGYDFRLPAFRFAELDGDTSSMIFRNSARSFLVTPLDWTSDVSIGHIEPS